jgi:hypothetical protein
MASTGKVSGAATGRRFGVKQKAVTSRRTRQTPFGWAG